MYVIAYYDGTSTKQQHTHLCGWTISKCSKEKKKVEKKTVNEMAS